MTQNRGTLGSLYPGLILVGPNSQSNIHTFVCYCSQLHARNVTLSKLLGRFNISHKTCYLRLRWLFHVHTKPQNFSSLNILLLQTDITSYTTCRYIHNPPTQRYTSTFLTPDIINKYHILWLHVWISLNYVSWKSHKENQ